MKWEMKAFCDSDYGGDADSRRSVSGYVIYLFGCAVAWKSHGQKSVSLSSTEAEYKAVSEVVTDIMFIKMLLEFLGFQVALPITVHVDNIGAIYLAHNARSTGRTKHIDIHHHYVREYIEDGVVMIKFVRSEDNNADIFTKNLADTPFDKHKVTIMGEQT